MTTKTELSFCLAKIFVFMCDTRHLSAGDNQNGAICLWGVILASNVVHAAGRGVAWLVPSSSGEVFLQTL